MNDLRSSRRQFAKAALSSALLPASGLAQQKQALAALTPGIKITLQLPTDFNDEDLQFAQQIGVSYVNTGTTIPTFTICRR
jgi:hypothetical protein